ncbi:O-mycaminosyltylonolide 6-deoxyallosyltransferase [Methylobacterium cerastii]|uniref:O-mycaminosyltylonolide 6-deoxyallosyltransferase n=1 Tax=Methylobacterium cerastii TaxID=932741 RepID=A0ABQ4QND4_9HYPH|nr:nucleotide disphospho-sugar-binding domain-containing protein [Methylobacterium cerastii]GJD46770.1 O-mycaminosyltylonolide 6-deoxyallosyltransferase [Methylobacterium cerastii]
MQIRLVAIGSHGDVLPILALSIELIRRGYDVALAAPVPFEALASRAGVPFHGLGTQSAYDRSMADADLWHPIRGVSALFSQISEVTEQIYNWLFREAAFHDTLVVASSLSLGARIAQDKLGLQVITLHVNPMLVESRFASPRLPGLGFAKMAPSRLRNWLGRGAERYVIGPAALPSLNALRARLGLPAVRRLRHWWNSPSKVLLMFPDWFAPPQADWLPQAVQIGFPLVNPTGDAPALSSDLATFLAQGPAPLVFTYGTAMRQGHRFFETAIAVCRCMKQRGILLGATGDQIPSQLPDGLIHATYAPFSVLLPRSAALIHHGGIGTATEAFAAGIPQLIVPMAFDQFDVGERVGRLGLGTTLSQRRFTPQRAARCLTKLLTSTQVARCCRDVSKRMVREEGIVSACDAIEASIP